MFSSVIVQTLVLHTIFVYLVSICNMIYKETVIEWLCSRVLHSLGQLQRVKTRHQKSIFAQIFCTNTYIVSNSAETKAGKGYIE